MAEWVGGVAEPEGPNDAATASTWAELEQLLAIGTATIRVPGNAEIIVPNASRVLRLGEGQRLIGDRGGAQQGATLRVLAGSGVEDYPVISLGAGAVLAGLRVLGPAYPSASASTIGGVQTVEGMDGQIVRNCELAGWSSAAISVKASAGVRIEHCYLHDNFHVLGTSSAGYGVVVQNGDATMVVRRNVFDRNRHAIAGSGRPGEGYVAEENLVLQGGGRDAYHQFDMHEYDNSGIGGEYVRVLANLFDYGRYGTSNRQSVLLRAAPTSGPAEVYGNVFSQGFVVGSQHAIGQSAGVIGAIPDDATLMATNQFNVPFLYDAQSTPGSVTAGNIQYKVPSAVLEAAVAAATESEDPRESGSDAKPDPGMA